MEQLNKFLVLAYSEEKAEEDLDKLKNQIKAYLDAIKEDAKVHFEFDNFKELDKCLKRLS